jgi:hypothetical protein
MLLVEDDNIAGLTPETPDDKKVYFNIDSKTSEKKKYKFHIK